MKEIFADLIKDSIEIRIYGRNPNKMEYDSVPLNNSHYDKQIKQGWYSKYETSSNYHNDFISSGLKIKVLEFFKSSYCKECIG